MAANAADAVNTPTRKERTFASVPGLRSDAIKPWSAAGSRKKTILRAGGEATRNAMRRGRSVLLRGHFILLLGHRVLLVAHSETLRAPMARSKST